MKLFDIPLTWFEKFASKWESDGVKFSVYTFIAILFGGLFELIPPFFLSRTVVPIATVTPYTALELAGRDVYQKEGCNNCHTQMIRPFKWEVDRFDPQKAYGRDGYSKAGESQYEHPFLWGSKRTGPDLAHESQIQPSEDWQRRHLINPRETSPGSIMPAYPWLFEKDATVDAESIRKHMEGLIVVGVPYTQKDLDSVESSVQGKTDGDALVAYLLRLGKDTANLVKTIK
ncbi:cbb3-type cytochrome c oxidase subunit II [Leptospira sp. GIMC2001]|uniref:cbb3-type cytochrome c oxidase subunit II n=1 Tax=Leptospira sp. GIMC2001 TaxID=1513297 RepID=UPI00234983F9|nr:cbb3-type cytochrome c oxidase subunit II [Leptospira sp. GIMC2001]WCL50510.1 cbb3-type cytochrome c oxidase subunit II [Leptospira sp. GIMC2001]